MSDATWIGSDAPEAGFSDYYALLKPKVMRLVVFTALVGLVTAPVMAHPVIALAALICIAVGAGASGALNMWWDADIDRVMERTAKRPVPSGKVEATEAMAIGLTLSAFSVVFLFLFTNALAAGLLAFTIFFYAVVYTMWLKRSTAQNIVIGGAAGAFPPVIGWAAMTGSISLEPILMFLLIFLWTPPHFWALALFRNGDYQNAQVPMLPVVAGTRATRRQVWLYALILAPLAVLPAFTPVGGLFYLIGALVLNAIWLAGAWAIRTRDDWDAEQDKFRVEKRFFGFSILYLFAHFALLLVEAGLRAVGWELGAWPML
ncbi:MAG: heme o synthase [Pseudomonadota bacterium]